MKRWMMLELAVSLALAAAGGPAPCAAFDNSYRIAGAGTELGCRFDRLYGRALIDGVGFDLDRDGDFGRATSADIGGRYRAGECAEVEFRYLKADQDGTLGVPVRIGGATRAAGSALAVDLTSFELRVIRPLRAGPKGKLDLTYGFRQWNYRLTSRDATGESVETYAFPLPEIGIAGVRALNERVDLYGEWCGSRLERGRAGALSRAVELGVRGRVGPRHPTDSDLADWTVAAGWRADCLSGHDGPDDDRDDLILDREGPRLAVTASF